RGETFISSTLSRLSIPEICPPFGPALRQRLYFPLNQGVFRMEELLAWRLEDVPPEQLMLVVAGMAGVGIVYCFFGYRLIKLVLGLTGFLLAGSAASFIVGFLSYGHLVAMGVALCIGGLCGAMALF